MDEGSKRGKEEVDEDEFALKKSLYTNMCACTVRIILTTHTTYNAREIHSLLPPLA